MLWPIVLACKMTRFEILNVFLFIGVFPALWILAAVLDRFLPTDSRLHSPREERKRQHQGEDSWEEAHEGNGYFAFAISTA